MSLEDGLETYLKGVAAVAAIVDDDVHHLELPHGDEYPALIYRRIDTPRPRNLDGPVGVARSRVQIDAWARTGSAVRSLASAVRTALDGYQGTWSGVVVRNVALLSERDKSDPSASSSINELRGVQMDFRIVYEETIPAF